MIEFLRQIWEPIAKLPRTQQIALGATVSLVFFGILFAAMWGSQKEFIPLFGEELKIDDAGKVVAKLKELNVEFKLGKNSSDILVPLTDKSYILLQLSQEKVLPQARPGWEKLIDQRSILSGQTQQEFELNFIRGLQDELEVGLIRLEPIENAKVYIVKPKKEVFKEDQKESTASVFLKIKPGFDITKEQIRAIRDWVSSAVEGLKPENIRITDTMARDLSRLLAEDEDMSLDKIKSAQLKFRRDYEKELEHKLQSQLETVFGRAVVRVTASMDFDQKEAVSDLVIPPIEGSNQGIPLSEKIEQEEYKGKDITTEGEPGVNSNVPPGSPAYPGKEDGTNNEYKRSASIRNLEVSRSKEKFIKEQGVVRRISVSVILDKDPKKLGGDTEEAIRSIAQATVEFNKKRGDVLTLMIIPFNNDLSERASREMDDRQRQEKSMFLIVIGLLMSIPIMIGMVYIFVRLSRARTLYLEKSSLESAAKEAIALQQEEESRRTKLEAKRLQEQAKRFEDIKNFFPEVEDLDDKKRKLQELRYRAYLFARDNEKFPQDFDEMIPEEQFIFQEAFKRKADGTLDDGLERLTNIINEREKIRQEHLGRLQADAKAKMNLEERVRNMVTGNPEDAVQVLRSWLGE